MYVYILVCICILYICLIINEFQGRNCPIWIFGTKMFSRSTGSNYLSTKQMASNSLSLVCICIYMYVYVYAYVYMWVYIYVYAEYRLFYRISSLLYGSFAKETYNFKETKQMASNSLSLVNICTYIYVCMCI